MTRCYLAVLVFTLCPAIASAQPAPVDSQPQPEPPPPPPPQPPPEPQPQPQDPVAACKQLRHDMTVRATAIPDAEERGRVLLSMPDCDHVDPRALGELVAAEQAAPATPPRATYHHTGFAFGARLELVPTLTQAALLTQTTTALFIGYQGDGVAVGGLLSLDHESSSGANGAPGASATTAQIGAQVRGTLARSETGATELLLVADGSFTSLGASADAMPPTLYTFHFGPSLRHWLTPSFALAVTGAGRFDVTSQPGEDTTVIATLAYSLDLEGVF